MTEQKVILSIRNLKVNFNTYKGVAQVLNNISLDVYEREVLGLVGETGCGKSVTALSILRLIDYPGEIIEGEILFHNQDLLLLSNDEMRRIRGNRIAMIFQDPTTYLNPVYTIGDQIGEAIKIHQSINSKKQIEEGVIKVLKLVRMSDPEKVVKLYPHELSGGMKQRCMIATALSCNPELLIADEATTNLDVTIQAKVLQLMMELKNLTNASMIIITHDMGVVAETCDRVAVMYAGDIVEESDVFSLFDKPMHPYTIGLLEAIPKLHEEIDQELTTITGTVPSLINIGPGCRFHPRCTYSTEKCLIEKPEKMPIGPRHFSACHHLDKVRQNKYDGA
jgi:oligopeptide/dipeptide ABC transporter ATP-binding protein